LSKAHSFPPSPSTREPCQRVDESNLESRPGSSASSAIVSDSLLCTSPTNPATNKHRRDDRPHRLLSPDPRPPDPTPLLGRRQDAFPAEYGQALWGQCKEPYFLCSGGSLVWPRALSASAEHVALLQMTSGESQIVGDGRVSRGRWDGENCCRCSHDQSLQGLGTCKLSIQGPCCAGIFTWNCD
jgi:hypothetical protein